MRISFITTFLLITSLQLLIASPTKGQSMITTKVSIGLTHESFENAIKKIEQLTSFRFYYRRSDIKNLDNLNLPDSSRTLAQTLQQLLQNTFLTFRQIDNNILIEKLEQQLTYEVRGKVVGTDRQPLAYATVSIRKNNTAAYLGSVITDTGGQFKINVNERGNYLVTISSLDMDSLSIKFTLTDERVVELPEIMLAAKSHTLKAVSVVTRKAFIEQKIDRTIVNVGSLLSNEGANALEVLEKSPGVIIEGNGSINFKGKSGVLILIDGKPTYLSGDNLTAYLRTLPSSSIDQIELMDNPPAKYDAAGNAGVINIKTKRSKIAGLNGSFAASYGRARYGQSSESLSLNYRVNKVNLFANTSYNFNQGYRQLDLARNYFDNSGNLTSAFEQTQYIKPKSNNINAKLGMDYYVTPKTIWGFVLTGLLSPTTMKNPSVNNLYNKNHLIDSVIRSENSSKSHLNNGGINLNYSHQFDSSGSALTFDLDYLKYNARSRQTFLNQTFDAGSTLTNTQIITDNLPTDINIYSAKVDYSQPLKGKAKFEAGLKSSYVNTDNVADYFNLNNGISSINYNLSNRFFYKENINAGYVNFNNTFNRFAMQAGLRVENTNANGHQLGNVLHADSSFIRSYANLFPTGYLSYKLDSTGSHLLVASYGRRIGRPYYQDLNPFVLLSDRFTYSAGNPYLKPQIADNYKLAYNYKSVLSIGLYYNYIRDMQSELVRQQGDIFIDGTGNLGTATYAGASVNLTLEPAKWWFLNTYVQVFRSHFKGQLYASYLDQALTFGEGNVTNQFTLPKGWSLELSGYYVMRRTTGQQINYPVGQLNGGIQKKLFNNKAAIRFSARDILHTYTADGIINFIPNANSTFRNRFNSQSLTLGFTYNFGKAVNNTRKRNAGAAENEKGRVKN